MSDSGYRKNIEEIIVKYELEPSLDKELYVEGSTDNELIEWYLNISKIHNISLFEIDNEQK